MTVETRRPNREELVNMGLIRVGGARTDGETKRKGSARGGLGHDLIARHCRRDTGARHRDLLGRPVPARTARVEIWA